MTGSDSEGIDVTNFVGCPRQSMDTRLTTEYDSNLFGVPSYSADGLSIVVGKGKTLFLCLHIPDGDKTTAGACHQNMRNLFIPIQAFDVVGTSGVSKTEWVLDVVQVRDEELPCS